MTKAKHSFTVTAILDAANTIEAADKLRGLLESNGFEQTSCECGGVTLGPKTVRVITNAPVAATRTATAHAARKTATPTMCSRSDATRMTVTTRSTSAKTIGATIPNARKTPSDTPSNAKDEDGDWSTFGEFSQWENDERYTDDWHVVYKTLGAEAFPLTKLNTKKEN